MKKTCVSTLNGRRSKLCKRHSTSSRRNRNTLNSLSILSNRKDRTHIVLDESTMRLCTPEDLAKVKSHLTIMDTHSWSKRSRIRPYPFLANSKRLDMVSMVSWSSLLWPNLKVTKYANLAWMKTPSLTLLTLPKTALKPKVRKEINSKLRCHHSHWNSERVTYKSALALIQRDHRQEWEQLQRKTVLWPNRYDQDQLKNNWD